MKGVRESWNAQLHFVVAKLVAHELDCLFVIAVSGFDKFNYLRKRDIAAEKGIEAKWDSRFIPFIALSEPGSLGSQPANNVFIRRRGVDIARDFAVDAFKIGELKEVRLL